MSRKQFGLLALCLLLAVGIAGGSLLFALKRVPEFYVEAMAAEIAPEVRLQVAEEFVAGAAQLVEDIKHEPEWSREFTQDQINSWVIEKLQKEYARHVPPGVSDPRVLFEEGVILLGFRYEQKRFKGIVSLRIKPSIDEPNRLSLEIESIRAGAVSLPLKRYLDKVSQSVEATGWKVEWIQSENGHDVAILHLDHKEEKWGVFEALEVSDGAIRLSGKGRAEDETKR